MGLVSFDSDQASVLPGPHQGNALVTEGYDGIYPLHAGLFDPHTQYGMPKSSLNGNEEFRQIGPWNTEMNTAVDTSAVNLEPITQYRPMSQVPAFNNFETAITEFGPYSGISDHTPSASPSQSSSATRSLSMSATMDLSSRSSSVYPSHSIVNNPIERAQPDTFPFHISAAGGGRGGRGGAGAGGGGGSGGGGGGRASLSSSSRASSLPSPPRIQASTTRTGNAASTQEAEAIMGSKQRSQSINATQKKDRKSRRRSADAPPIATDYTGPSANPVPGMVTAADGPPFSTSPSHSELSNLSQAPVPVPVPQVPRSSQRQRNRRAATKCREKTKAAMIQLEATEKAASMEHMELSKTVADLRGEVLALKNQLLLHGNCECDVIQKYLRNAARNIGEGPGPSGNYTSSQGLDGAWTRPSPYSRHNSYS